MAITATALNMTIHDIQNFAASAADFCVLLSIS